MKSKNLFTSLLPHGALAGTAALATGLALASSAFTAAPAQAFQFKFDNITNNNAANALAGETQLFLDVFDASGGENLSATQALFKFSNAGQALSSITQIYFEDQLNALSSIASGGINNSGADVSFSVDTGSLNLPGGNDPNVNFTEEFGIKADNPVQHKGVNPGEWVSVLFNLNTGKTLQNVFNDLAGSKLRVGFHVQGFANGGSEAFVNLPQVVGSVTPPASSTTPPASSTTPPASSTTPPASSTTPPASSTTPPASSTTPPASSTTPPASSTPPVQSVPEPATLAGLGLVAGTLAASRRRRVSQNA